VTAEFGTLPDDDRLPPRAQESLFRIAQEALSNVARHARAVHVRLHLGQRETGGSLVLEIQDDGQGFHVGADHSGMGLDNVRQRVQALGGKLEIDSSPGSGTRVQVSIPLLSPAARRAGDRQLYGPDHMLNRTLLTGFGGGLALIAALFYPLYVLLPGRYIEGWMVGSSALGLLLGIVAVLLVVATGLLAARWSAAPRPSAISPSANWRCCTCWPTDAPTARLRRSSCSARKRSKHTSGISWPSYTLPTARRPSYTPSSRA
jgi:hypothetical protein